MRSLSDKQRQFRANFEGWCSHLKAPPAQVFDVREDRILFYGNVPKWVDWLDCRFPPWTKKIEDHQPTGEGKTALTGWHEPKAFVSAQVILHRSGFKGKFFELDWDWCNPDGGALPAMGHGLEVVWNKVTHNKTGPYAIRGVLVRRGIEVEKV